MSGAWLKKLRSSDLKTYLLYFQNDIALIQFLVQCGLFICLAITACLILMLLFNQSKRTTKLYVALYNLGHFYAISMLAYTLAGTVSKDVAASAGGLGFDFHAG